jgi:N-acyl-D-aspartate/D-glutamate deacylase
MAHDLIIRGGEVIDGTGAPSRSADVAIDGDRITEIGDLAGATAHEEIDATGLTVTPGFIDLHTHLDAQVAWDPYMTSSSWHGVTTTLIGNCGLSFAPVNAGESERLAEMMESVEDIPREAILGSLPWDWQTYPEYLDSVARMQPALNVVGLVGHAAVRYTVMGDAAHDQGADPTPEQLARMRDIVAESVGGGAVGFSTSRILLHRVPDGRMLPGTHATNDELLALADGMSDAGGGIFQVVPDYEKRAGNEFQLFTEMAARGADVLFTVGVGNDESVGAGIADLWGGFVASNASQPGTLTAYTMGRPSGTLMGLAHVAPVFGPRWRALMQLPTLDARVAALCDARTRSDLMDEANQKGGLWYDPRFIHPLGSGPIPEFHIEGGPSVADLAEAAGTDPVTYVVDRLIESEGRELFNVWYFHRNRAGLAPLLALDFVYPGAGDAGAHAGQICDADATTHFLSYWCRERDLVSLPEAIHRLTAKPAALLGLDTRGTLAPGAHADVNVFDPAGLECGYPEYVNDFPNGVGRLCVRAQGYAATLVNGAIVTRQGEHTGARPGRVLRDRTS